jgi:hypothetical protein
MSIRRSLVRRLRERDISAIVAGDSPQGGYSK